MNALYFTQSRSLDVLYEVNRRASDRLNIERAGYYVANLPNYERFIDEHPTFERDSVVLKEWEIYREAENHQPDLARIRSYEEKIGDPVLWGPLLTDRRIYLGPNATYRQDYRPNLTHDQMLAILDVALMRIDELFQRLSPKIVCTIYTATFGDCLAHLFARGNNIRSFDVRLARLQNYIMLGDNTEEPPPHIAHICNSFKSGMPIPPELEKAAEAHIDNVVTKNAMYEGVVPAKEKSAHKAISKSGKNTSSRVIPFLKKWFSYRKPPYIYDPQTPDLIRTILFRKLLNPMALRRTRRALRSKLVGLDQLSQRDYILYPLHTEPELVLTQFARPFLNQVEVIRSISLSMPVGMKLIVKEHPLMLGRRPLTYYEKLMEIPNVELVDLDLPSEDVLRHAKLVVVIRGAIGLEAVIKQIPVVALGKSLFELLPRSMFRRCHDLYELANDIRTMLTEHRHDHAALVRYLAAVIKGSCPVNLVSDLLGKAGRFRTDAGTTVDRLEDHPHLDVLADHFVERVQPGKDAL